MGIFNKKKIEEEKLIKTLEDKKREVESEVNQMREEHREYIDEHNNLIEKAQLEGKPVEDEINKHQQEQRKDINKPIKENLYETYSFGLKLFEKSILLLCLGTIMALIIWAFRYHLQSTIQADKNLVVWIVVMAMLMLVVLLLNLGTGTGIEIWKRFIYKFKYRKGIYVNGIIAMKSGVWKEFFIKKEETGEIRINTKPYVPNPKLLFVYKGIPSYFYREGCPDPLNYWEQKLTIDFSCAEVDKVMYSAGTFDFKAWLKKMGLIFLIGVGITVIFALVSAIFAYMANDMLKKGTYNIEPIKAVCVNLYNTTTTMLTNNTGIPIPKPIIIGG